MLMPFCFPHVCSSIYLPISKAGFELESLHQSPKCQGYMLALLYLAAFWIFNQCDTVISSKFFSLLDPEFSLILVRGKKILHFNLNLSSLIKILLWVSHGILNETQTYILYHPKYFNFGVKAIADHMCYLESKIPMLPSKIKAKESKGAEKRYYKKKRKYFPKYVKRQLP